LVIFGPKTGARRLLFRYFLENNDFVQIVLLLIVGTRFCRVGPFKNRSGERVRTTPAKNATKNASGAVSGRTFFVTGNVFGHFWDALGSQKDSLWADFRQTFAAFWATVGWHVTSLSARTLGKALGIDFECPGESPRTVLGNISLFLSKFCLEFGPSCVHTSDHWVFRHRGFWSTFAAS